MYAYLVLLVNSSSIAIAYILWITENIRDAVIFMHLPIYRLDERIMANICTVKDMRINKHHHRSINRLHLRMELNGVVVVTSKIIKYEMAMLSQDVKNPLANITFMILHSRMYRSKCSIPHMNNMIILTLPCHLIIIIIHHPLQPAH